MTTGFEVMTGEPETGVPRREPWRRSLITLELLLGIAGVAGGISLMAASRTAMPLSQLTHTPFSTWFWPGVLLLAVNGVLPLVVAGAALRGRVEAHVGHLAVGLGLVGWIAVQVVLMGLISWLQPTMLAWGLVITWLATLNYRAWAGL